MTAATARLILLATTISTTITVLLYPIDVTLIIALIFTWLLIIIAAIDCAHLIIPDPLNYILLWSGLALTLLPHLSLLTATQAITGAIIGYLSLWTIAKTFLYLRKKPGIGHGDFKLLAALGAWNGWQTLAITVFISSVLALLYCGIYYSSQRKILIQVPFAPFLASSGWMIYLYQHMIQ